TNLALEFRRLFAWLDHDRSEFAAASALPRKLGRQFDDGLLGLSHRTRGSSAQLGFAQRWRTLFHGNAATSGTDGYDDDVQPILSLLYSSFLQQSPAQRRLGSIKPSLDDSYSVRDVSAECACENTGACVRRPIFGQI